MVSLSPYQQMGIKLITPIVLFAELILVRIIEYIMRHNSHGRANSIQQQGMPHDSMTRHTTTS